MDNQCVDKQQYNLSIYLYYRTCIAHGALATHSLSSCAGAGAGASPAKEARERHRELSLAPPPSLLLRLLLLLLLLLLVVTFSELRSRARADVCQQRTTPGPSDRLLRRVCHEQDTDVPIKFTLQTSTL